MPFIYQNNFSMRSGFKPGRIVSLVPSQTELLYDLGLDAEVVGITKFCVHPGEWLMTKERVGGTKNADIEKIKSLQPDLILANREENVKEQVEALAELFPVYLSDIGSLDDAIEMMQQIGSLVQKETLVAAMVESIIRSFNELEKIPSYHRKLQACYLIWRNPYMTIGGDTYISDIMECCGFDNVFVDETRYPEVTISRLKMERCNIVFLSTEPYPFRERHIEELQRHLPGTKIIVVDGEMFSWYGSRLLRAPAYFRELMEVVGS